jgi:tetratricopeptide (TPR) repeat protein
VQNRRWLLVVAALFAALSIHHSAAAQLRHTVDDQELRDVRADSPAAADAYLQAEARLRLADWAAAERLLASARALQPHSFLLARRDCQVLTQLGQRNQAIAACKVALSGLTAMDQRAYVGALMSGGELVKPKELSDAVKEAAHARNLQGQPFADAAFCEIAQHIGDDAMYSACLVKLETNARGYFETARWRAVRPGTPVWLYWLGWSLLGVLSAVTLTQSFVRWFRAPALRTAKPRSAALVVLALGAFGAHRTRAAEVHQQLSHFRINFDDPESQIPTLAERNSDPLEFGYFIQDLAAEGVFYERKQDYATAVKFWRASAKAVPDEAVAFARACQDYQRLGERDNALSYCSRALNLQGVTSADYVRFGELTVQKFGPLTTSEVDDLNAAVAHVAKQENGSAPAAVMECQLGVKLEDEAKLAHCTSVLAKSTPNDPHTLTFEWSLAMKRRNYGEARRLVDAMSKTSLPAETLAQIRTATAEESAWWRRPFTDARYGLGLACLLGLGAVLVFRKRAQLRSGALGTGLSTSV